MTTARERIEACLALLQRENPRLNAVAIPLYDDARRQASELDDRRSRGAPAGPLDGTPFVVKEVFDVAGTPSTAGIKGLASTLARVDGPLVARLKAAGAILVAKANAAQLMLSMETSNPVYGRTSNPFDPARSPGGSSGGDAALIGAGVVSFGLGTDIGGSVRIPAHFCGIAALRPTRGRLTLEGSANYTLYPGPEADLDQPGPMACTVDELTRVSRVLLEEPLTAPALAGLRVGFYVDDGVRQVSPALRRAVREAAAGLRASGVSVESFVPPDVGEAHAIWLGIISGDGCATLRTALGEEPADPSVALALFSARLRRPTRAAVSWLTRAMGQRQLSHNVGLWGRRPADDIPKLLARREAYIARFLEAMDHQKLDALVCPPFVLPAVLHSATRGIGAVNSYTMLFNLTGMPAGVVAATRVRADEESDRRASIDLVERTSRRVERGSAGLPVGVQVAARHGREDVVLGLMAALETYFADQLPRYVENPNGLSSSGT